MPLFMVMKPFLVGSTRLENLKTIVCFDLGIPLQFSAPFCHDSTEARIYSSEIVQWKEWGHVGLRDEFATAITRRVGTLEQRHCDRTLEWWLVGMTIPRSLISG